jgi:uncharacterized protein YdaU (DUF1376 family)
MNAKPLSVQYCAADFLSGTMMLSPLAELAYRRICDMIYNCGDRLADDDSKMRIATKTERKWQAVKRELIKEGKITISGGCIHVEGCTKEFLRAEGIVEQRRGASKAAAEKRKLLKQQRTGSAGGLIPGTPSGAKRSMTNSGPKTSPKSVSVEPTYETPEVVMLESDNPLENQNAVSPGDTPTDPHLGTSKSPLTVNRSVNADPDNLPTVKLVGDNVLLLCGVEPESWQHDYEVVGTWLNKGADPVLDIYPTVLSLVKGNPEFEPPRSAGGLRYFTAAIARAMAERVSKDNGSELVPGANLR